MVNNDDGHTTTRGLASEAIRHAATTLLNYQDDAQAICIIEAYKGEGDKTGVAVVALERPGIDPKAWVKAVYHEVRAMAKLAGVDVDAPAEPGRIITLN